MGVENGGVSSYRLTIDQLQAVVERARDNDANAWEALYRHSYGRLVTYAQRRLQSPALAEDAVSDTFARAIERIDTFTWQGAGFDAWIYGILRNVVLETYRSRDLSHQRLENNYTESAALVDLTEISSGLERAEEIQRLRRAFGSLGPDDREILELRVVGGMSSDAVAEVIGKGPGAVRMAQSRALQRLRSALKELDNAH